MLIKAVQKNTRQTPRKLRFVTNTVKSMSIEQAFKQLSVMERKASSEVAKVLRTAVANATNNFGYPITDLEIDSMFVGEGPRFRRFNAVSRGRAHSIIKRSSHITVILKTKDEAKAVKKTDKDKKVKATVQTEGETAPVESMVEVNAAKQAATQQSAAVAKPTKVTAKRPVTRKVITKGK